MTKCTLTKEISIPAPEAPFIDNLYEQILIALVHINGATFCIKETHSLMDAKSHKEFHNTISTYVLDRGGFSGYTLNSTTLADKQPSVGAYTLADEDNETEIPSLTGGNGVYTQFYLSGASLANVSTDLNEVVSVGVNGRPNYQEVQGGNWVDVQMPNNYYGKVFEEKVY